MFTRSHKLFLVLGMVGAVAFCTAGAAVADILYQDDFEQYSSVSHAAFPDSTGDFDPTNPTVGTVAVNEQYAYNVQVTDHTGGGDPSAAAQGTKYLRINSHTLPNDYDTANFTATGLNQTGVGDHVTWEQMLNIPVQQSGVVSVYGVQADGATNLFNLQNDVSGFVKRYDYSTGFVLTSVPYTAGQWEKWTVDYTIGDSVYTLTVGNNSASLPTSFGVGTWGSSGVAAANYMGGTESIGVDSCLITNDVPEPSGLCMIAAGLISLLAYAWRKRK